MQPQTLTGHTIVFTGTVPELGQRSDATAQAILRGATVTNTVSRNVSYLVVQNLYHQPKKTTKLAKAEALGIAMIDHEEFMEVFHGHKTLNFAFAPKTPKPEKITAEKKARQINSFISNGLKHVAHDFCI